LLNLNQVRVGTPQRNVTAREAKFQWIAQRRSPYQLHNLATPEAKIEQTIADTTDRCDGGNFTTLPWFEVSHRECTPLGLWPNRSGYLAGASPTHSSSHFAIAS
jgi:hypothetical protein